VDNVLWQVLTAILTLGGLGISVVLWRLRGAAVGLRAVAWSMLPVAAYLTGVLRLLWEVGDAAVSWAVRFTFSPLAWLGISIAGVAVVLFLVSGAMRRRALGRSPEPAPRDASALPAERTRPAATTDSGARGRRDRGGAKRQPAGDADSPDDLDDIEAILRKHGIT
jgi:hypothetical protein